MTVLRRIELICGVLAGLAVMAGVVDFFFLLRLSSQCVSSAAPPGGSIQTTCFPVSYATANGIGSVAQYLVVFGAFSAIVVLGAVVHSLSGRSGWRGALWTGTALLLTSSLCGMFSIGAFLLPGAVLALSAAVLADVSARRQANAATAGL